MLKVLYLNEMEKLVCRKKYIFFLVFDLLAGLFLGAGQLLGAYFVRGELFYTGIFDDILVSGISMYLCLFLPIIAVMGCADLFSGELHDRSMRLLIQRPVERWQVYMTKLLAVYTLCVFFVVFHFAVLFLIKLIFAKSAAGVFYALGAYFLDLIPVFVTVAFFALIHLLVASAGSAVVLSFGVYLLLIVLGRYMDFGAGIFFTEYFAWHTMWLGNGLPLTALLPRVGILLGSAVLFYCAGLFVFEQREI